MKTALLLGASGLTGNLLLEQLLDSNYYEKIIVYVRKPLSINHPKLQQQTVDFENLTTAVDADDIFCCLGTTIKKAGSKEAFEKVDFEYPLQIAQLQKQAGTKNCFVITAMGSKKTSAIFYNRVKGKLEEALQNLGFSSLYIFRPSLIVGNRTEKRLGEKLGIAIFNIANFILPKNYQSVKAKAIAESMLHFAKNAVDGNHVILSGRIKEFE